MKIRILTLPLWGNYGGMLQAYALYRVCSSSSSDVEIVQVRFGTERKPDFSLSRLIGSFLSFVRRVQIFCAPLQREPVCIRRLLYKSAESFKSKFLRCCSLGDAPKDSDVIFVVGSDQVWRRQYVKGLLPTYFVDFATEKQRCRSIAYAASFGSDQWEGSPEETVRCGALLRQFKAVSVREHSGVRICSEILGADAVQMPDPTLLASQEDYERVIGSEKTRIPNRPFWVSYVLDKSLETDYLLQTAESRLGLYHQRMLPSSTARKRCDRFYCTVAQWLRYMRDCEAVVTDSFHACVFSIIYNKPFVCIGNTKRGSARFDTLLQTFGLETRLVQSGDPEAVLRVLHTPVDWDSVNAIRKSERKRGLDFLQDNLRGTGCA